MMPGHMTNPERKKKKVLFVDDEPAFLEMMRLLAEEYYPDAWEVFTAEGAGPALSMLQDQGMDLVVLDVQMPVVDGVQFLALLNRKYPHAQKVVLTGYANEEYRAQCLSGGAELFLEKPRAVDGFQVVFATLNELTRWKPESGFRGVLRQVGIQDLIQMECLSRHSSVMEVTAPGMRGEICIEEGAIVHAQIAEKTGADAFFQIIGLPGGEFSLKPFVAPTARTVEGQWEFLLMEACRQRDEAEAQAAAGPAEEADGTGGQEGESPAAGIAPAPEPVAPKTAAPGETAPPRERARIDEVLICSEQGEVLYEYACRDANARINLLEFISQRSRKLAQVLDTGSLARLELEGSKGRMVARFQNGCGVLVRASRYG